MKRRALLVSVLAAFLAAPGVASAEFERCCFRVQADVVGHLRADFGNGGTQELSWRWTVRQIARYKQGGRIFNALTEPRGKKLGGGLIRLALAERSKLLGRPPCARRVSTGGFRRAAGAYASLEDRTDGGVALVVRAGLPGRTASRCGRGTGHGTFSLEGLPGPWEYELRPPPGRSLREERQFRVVFERTLNLPLRLAPGLQPYLTAGYTKVIVRFTYFPRNRLREELERLAQLR